MKKVEVVRQVKLSPSQKIMLMDASNKGGKVQSRSGAYGDTVTLEHLGLIEQRDLYTAREKAAAKVRIAGLWGELAVLVRARHSDQADRKLDAIRMEGRSLDDKAYWLTKAADEYLAKGRVVVGEAKR